jgi:hypothetical protein
MKSLRDIKSTNKLPSRGVIKITDYPINEIVYKKSAATQKNLQ